MTSEDFDQAAVHIYDLNKVDEQMIDYIVCNHLLSASVVWHEPTVDYMGIE